MTNGSLAAFLKRRGTTPRVRRDLAGNVEQRIEDEDDDEDEYDCIDASPHTFLVRKRGASQGTTGGMEERHPPLIWQLVMLLASLVTVATLALSISVQLPPDVESMLRWADTAVCGIFLLDFLLLLHLA